MNGFREKQAIKGVEYTILKYLIILYPILISISRFIPIVGTFLTLILLCVLIIENIYSKKFWIKYSVIIILLIISSSVYTEISNHTAHIKVILIFFLSMDCYYRTFYERCTCLIKKYSKFIIFQIIIILGVNFIFFFNSLGYSKDYTQDWGFRAFQGIYPDPHQAAYHFCALLILILWISRYKYNFMQWLIIAGIEYCILMTGARVPTVLGIILGGIFCLDHRIKFKSNNKALGNIISYIPIILLALVTVVFMMKHTSFGVKILNATKGASFDNGRSGLREMDIKLFQSSDLFHKWFGNGTDAVIKSHKGPYNDAIWSHNDFFQILCGMGLIMFLFYCKQWISILWNMIKRKKYLGFLTVLICIIVAFYNGLYIHSRFVFVMPLLFLYFKDRKKYVKI
ncbi:O-antigen ligase family protein [Clostridium sp.]|uniref:O-antigen ligase family protein n=1 Tax=Clostridium sp. TaxID=1506 RepID=UPI003522B783